MAPSLCVIPAARRGKEDVQGRKATWGLRHGHRKPRCRTRGGRNARAPLSHWPLRCSRGAKHGTEPSAPTAACSSREQKRNFTSCGLRRESNPQRAI
jgi:hypothetical protein